MTKTSVHKEAGAFLLSLNTRQLEKTGIELDEILRRYGWRGLAGYYSTEPAQYQRVLREIGML